MGKTARKNIKVNHKNDKQKLIHTYKVKHTVSTTTLEESYACVVATPHG